MPILLSILGSRLAQLGLALAIGFGWGWVNTSARWREYVAQQDAARQVAHQIELRRQADNAREIAVAATQRVEEDAVELAKLQKQIEDFDRSQTNVKDPCAIDDTFYGAARKLRQPFHRNRPAKVTRPPK